MFSTVLNAMTLLPNSTDMRNDAILSRHRSIVVGLACHAVAFSACIGFFTPTLATAAEITVSSDPRASASTIQGALELVRAELAAQKKSGRREAIVVNIAPGRYRIQQPITLGAGDSG